MIQKKKKKLNPIQKYAKRNPQSPYSKAFLEGFHSYSGIDRKTVVKLAKGGGFTKPDARIYHKYK